MTEKRTRSVWRRVLLVLLLAVAGAALWVRHQLREGLPQTSGTVSVRGLAGPATIARNAIGIPTITATSTSDAHFGLGYVHAQERFFEMELARRGAQGRLSEAAGAAAVERDMFVRTIGLYRAAEVAEQALLPATRDALTAYTAGVNAWLESHRDALPPELVVLKLTGRALTPEPWRVADSIAVQKMMALMLSGGFMDELQRAELEDKLGPEHTAELFPPYPANGPVTVASAGREQLAPPAPARFPAAPLDEAFASLGRISDELGIPRGRDEGSNSWVIGPRLSKSGAPILSNDPHLSAQSPSLWYFARLEAPGLSVEGATIPGIPVVVVGRNANIAWGVTNLQANVTDLFVEKLAPGDSTRYVVGDHSEPFTTRTEQVRVAGEPQPRTFVVRATRNGPIVRDDWKGRGPLALRWTALDPDDTTLDAFVAIDTSTDWDSFRAALARYVSPCQNFLYADAAGHIGYSASGRIPVRKSGQGLVPTPGWNDETAWTGFIPYAELPMVLDPAEGYIASANNRIAGDGYPHYISSAWADPYRIERIRQLISGRPGPLDLDGMARIHADVHSNVAEQMLPVMTKIEGTTPAEKDALARLRAWDREVTVDSTPGAIFIAWYGHLLPLLVRDELGPELYLDYGKGHRPSAMTKMLADPTQRWCDVKGTPVVETCNDVLTLALHEALEDLGKRLGADVNGWQVGKLGRVRFDHPVFGRLPVLGAMFSRAVAQGGDLATVRVSGYAYAMPFDIRHIATFFADYDLSPGGDSRAVLAPGQSGHPSSPHYDDQLAAWLTSKGPSLHDHAGEERLELRPR